ncbi:hypothetical protein BC628DRAFT_1453625 [Trametes gibbosa]|nr:hypothetical protein BC628DRAFT_1453625 [Trametes gibbosa]
MLVRIRDLRLWVITRSWRKILWPTTFMPSPSHCGVLELLLEIWLNVFVYATHIPGALSQDDTPATIAFAGDQIGISTHRRHREATGVMLAGCRVYKPWASIATEFLCKYLLVKSEDHAAKITTAT